MHCVIDSYWGQVHFKILKHFDPFLNTSISSYLQEVLKYNAIMLDSSSYVVCIFKLSMWNVCMITH